MSPLRQGASRMRAQVGKYLAPSLSGQDADVLRRADAANIRTAAYCHVAVAAVLTITVIGYGLDSFGRARYGHYAILADLGLAAAGVGFVHWRRARPWAPYVLACLDVVFLVAVMALYPHFPGALPPELRAATVSVWCIFLALALATIRGRPWLLAGEAVVLSAGFMICVARVPLDFDGERLERQLAIVFGPAYDATRALVVVLTGALLVVAAVRAQVNLRSAVTASRRAVSLARYFAPTIAEIVAETEMKTLRDGRQQLMAILFADIRGFTALSRSLPPRELATFLSRFRTRATEAIEREGGIVDKFVGDEVMGVFGLPSAGSDDAANAIRAAQRLLDEIDDWNDERRRAGYPPVRIGVGLHYGPVFVGALGGTRLEFTVLGDTVNVARRIEEFTKSFGHDLIASSDIVAAATGEPATAAWAVLPAQTISRQHEPTRLYGCRRHASVFAQPDSHPPGWVGAAMGGSRPAGPSATAPSMAVMCTGTASSGLTGADGI